MRPEEIVKRALRMVKPKEDERRRLEKITEQAHRIVSELSEEVPGILDVSIEGSAAKDTWIRERMEADIFIHFDPKIPREDMEEKVIRIGVEAIKRLGGKPTLMYAEHPYVEGVIRNVTVDIVACYRVEPPNWISATDRTPHHTRYVRERLNSRMKDEVRLLKSFLLSCGAYGAEIKVRGFSGYLSELITLAHGGFLETVKAASMWKPPIVIDIEGSYESKDDILKAFQDSNLIVVDPVDRERNVAAAVSDTKLAEFILASKFFIRSPSLSFFKQRSRRITLTRVRRLMKGRKLLLIFFRVVGEPPPDVLWGELRKTEKGVRKALERIGFKVYRVDSWTNLRDCILTYELNFTELPRYELRKGPPAYLDNSIDFALKWVRKGVSGPWLEGFRLHALSRRRETGVEKLLRREIKLGRVSVARDLQKSMINATITTRLDKLPRRMLRDPGFQSYIHDFLQHRPNYL